MAGGYTNIGTIKEEKDKIRLQIAKGLFNIDPTRKNLAENEDLSKVTGSYSILESVSTPIDGEIYAKDTTDNLDGTITTETVLPFLWTATLTAVRDYPEDFLLEFIQHRWDDEWYFTYLDSANVSITEISAPRDTSVPVDGGFSWEERATSTLTIPFMAKKVSVVNLIDKLSYSVTTVEGDSEITSEGEVDAPPSVAP